MSDHLMRGVRVRLTTTMDTILKTAVLEVMRVLESALYDHKMEIAQRGEEIAQLKLKLQNAELKLKDFEMSRQRLQERAITNPKTDPKVAPGDPGQSTTVPEVDVEVPDDWCAPLGFDTPTKQEEGFCPSVRLRQFSIRLSPVPLVKHEVEQHATNDEEPPSGRRSKRISALNQKAKQSQEKNSPPVVIQALRRPKLSGDLNKLLRNLNEDYCNLNGLDRLRKRKTSEGKVSDNDGKEKEDVENPSKRIKENESRNKHVCESCNRVFSTIQAHCLHVRSQKRCRGCSMTFCFKAAAEYHVGVCPKYKEWKERRRSKKSQDKNALKGSETRAIMKKESVQSSADGRKPFTKYTCKQCNFETKHIKKFRRHMLSHSHEAVTCRICLKKFFKRKALALHMIKKHTSEVQLGEKV